MTVLNFHPNHRAELVVPDPMSYEDYYAPELTYHEPAPIYRAEGYATVPGSRDKAHWTVSMPSTVAARRLTVGVGGYGGIELIHNVFRDASAAENDMPMVTFDPLRHGEGAFRDPQRIHADTIAAVIEDVLLSEAVLDLPGGNLLDCNQVNLAVHSMSGISGMRRARQHPEEIHSVNLVEAVGAQPRVGVAGFVRRVPGSLRKEIVPALLSKEFHHNASTKEVAKDLFEYFFSVMAAGEILSCGAADIADDLEQARAEGVHVSMLYGENDTLIPALPAIRALGNRVNYWEIADMNHLAPQEKGRFVARRVAAIINDISDPVDTSRLPLRPNLRLA